MQQTKRLYFIDAMRAWAILMMLQGHFIDGLLDPVFRDPENAVFATWKYFRGITAPVFFTVSGFIFTYLLIRAPRQGAQNPRIRKGYNRGLQLIGIGYLLRANVFGLLKGQVYNSFFLVDVLHCIGMALLVIVALYLLSSKIGDWTFPYLLLATGILLFVFEPAYKAWDYNSIPQFIANYFTKANGSVFTIIPWVGYAAIGGFLAHSFFKNRSDKNLYLKSLLLSIISGYLLIWHSSTFFSWMKQLTCLTLFEDIVSNNYLFIRLGNVMIVFTVFILLRSVLTKDLFLRIGQNTLSIYIIHFIILYGSFTGFGLYKYLHHSLTPAQAIPGAILFMGSSTFLALQYDTHEEKIKRKLKYVACALKSVISSVWAKLIKKR
ncbi:MAG: hypothetical protein RLZZ241_1835 [Bacteroidota bacterium]|jgi:uncharacterized membrane protein